MNGLGMLAIACAWLAVVWLSNAQTYFARTITADALATAKIELVPAETVPASGASWLVQKNEPPWPCLPPLARELNLPVYWVAGTGMFIVDDRGVDYAAIAALDAALRAVEYELGLTSQTDNGPPVPGEGEIAEAGGSGSGGTPTWLYGGLCLLPPVFLSSNSILLSITNTEPGTAYDLFMTTNLSPEVPGLNLTNWLWLGRGQPGQTNFVVTDLTAAESYFRLGTMLDTDGDGLTDAFENLVSHTDRFNPDTDGDGLSDGWEWANGMNPHLNESALDAYRKIYTYDTGSWLRSVSGIWGKTIVPDNEGNILQLQ